MLPFGINGICQLADLVLLQRAKMYMAETIPSAQLGLDSGFLADGQPVLDQNETIQLVRKRFETGLPLMLKDRLSLAGIEISWHAVPYDVDHWMGAGQPRQLPVVTIRTVFSDCHGRSIPLQDSIELLMD
jgi:hypothetical protein